MIRFLLFGYINLHFFSCFMEIKFTFWITLHLKKCNSMAVAVELFWNWETCLKRKLLFPSFTPSLLSLLPLLFPLFYPFPFIFLPSLPPSLPILSLTHLPSPNTFFSWITQNSYLVESTVLFSSPNFLYSVYLPQRILLNFPYVSSLASVPFFIVVSPTHTF